MPAIECSVILKALSEKTRWRIVRPAVSASRATVSELAKRLNVPQPNISKHLRILRTAGIVVTQKQGLNVWCEVTPDFRSRLLKNTLDLGCCTFQFDQPLRPATPPAGAPG